MQAEIGACVRVGGCRQQMPTRLAKLSNGDISGAEVGMMDNARL